MEYRAFVRFYELIPQLQAREKLIGSVIAAFPHMTAKDRRDVQRQWMADAGVEILEYKRKVGWGQLRGWLHGEGGSKIVKIVDGQEVETEE